MDYTVYASEINIALIVTIFSLIQTALVAVVTWVFRREAKKREALTQRTEERAKIRAEESHLAMKMMSANGRLACATAIAVKGGDKNGNLDSAIAKVEAAESEYYNFINRIAAAKMAH
jgi:hypothetical protein